MQVFTRSAAVVDGRRGGRFQLLDGNVSGEFTQLVRSRLLSQSVLSCHITMVTRLLLLPAGTGPEDRDEVAVQDVAQWYVMMS